LRRLITVIALSHFLVACAASDTDVVSFNRMSDAEIATYNATVPMLQQVICRMEVKTGTWVKKRECRTHADIIMGKRNDVGTLNSANHGAAVISIN